MLHEQQHEYTGSLYFPRESTKLSETLLLIEFGCYGDFVGRVYGLGVRVSARQSRHRMKLF